MADLTPTDLIKQRRWVKLFLTIAIVSGLLALLQNIHLHFDPMAERHYGQLVHVRIGERDFAVPSEYFRGPIPHEETKSLYFWMMMPDYSPYRGEIKGDRAELRAAWDRHLMVRIEDTNYTNDMFSRYNAMRNGPMSIYKPEDVADRYGLRRTLVWKKNSQSHDLFINTDLYSSTSADGKLLLFVSCGRDDDTVNPGCSFHEFTDGRLLYTLTYRKSNLPKWQEMQSRVHNLIESFSCVPYSSSISTKIHTGEKICPH
jgi:hypothetical protein